MVKNAALVLAGARRAGIPVIHVVHRGGAYKEVSLDTEVHAGVAPAPGDHVIYKTKTKTKTSPFSTTGLDVMLREMGRDSLVLMGVSTADASSPLSGGPQISTTKWRWCPTVVTTPTPRFTGC